MTEAIMPDKKTLERAEQDKREGKSPSTQAGEFVREEMEHIREGKHGARSAKQAIAIGLSKAPRVLWRTPLGPPQVPKGAGTTKLKIRVALRNTQPRSSSFNRRPARSRPKTARAGFRAGDRRD